jgi:hypothetical protein
MSRKKGSTMRKGELTETGARFADRNELAANWHTIARATWNMHDALLLEQRRTNQLLEALIKAQGGDVPHTSELPNPSLGPEIDPGTGLPASQVVQ